MPCAEIAITTWGSQVSKHCATHGDLTVTRRRPCAHRSKNTGWKVMRLFELETLHTAPSCPEVMVEPSWQGPFLWWNSTLVHKMFRNMLLGNPQSVLGMGTCGVEIQQIYAVLYRKSHCCPPPFGQHPGLSRHWFSQVRCPGTFHTSTPSGKVHVFLLYI